MKPGSFILNGVNSESLKLVIQNRPELESPVRKVTFKSAYGVDGDLPFDEDSYNNTEMELYMYMEGSPINTASINRERVYNLFNSGSYLNLIPYFDDTKTYRVMLKEPPKFDSKYFYGEGQSIELKLTVLPYKYYVNSPKSTLSVAGSITNPKSISSQPVIKIFGSGNVTLKVNGIDFVITNITGDIVLDCAAGFAYRDVSGAITNENSKTHTRRYPFLKPGGNSIAWTGTVSKVEIEPRWRSLV